MEEPPPHVVFMMATTELHKIPDTILSRAQVFELRTIGTRPIADQLREIADAEGVRWTTRRWRWSPAPPRAACATRRARSIRCWRSATERSMPRRCRGARARRPRSAARHRSTSSRARTRRRVFDVAARLVESGHDLRHVCRELARLVRDLMVLQVDPDRASRSGVRDRGRRRAPARAGRGVLARGSAARVRPDRQAGNRSALRARSRATTSRWRCCAGCTCAGWCRCRTDRRARSRARRCPRAAWRAGRPAAHPDGGRTSSRQRRQYRRPAPRADAADAATRRRRRSRSRVPRPPRAGESAAAAARRTASARHLASDSVRGRAAHGSATRFWPR